MMLVSGFCTGSGTMAGFEKQSSTKWATLRGVVLVVTLLILPRSSCAEIILDDFDEAFEIILPGGANRPYIVQPGIGLLGRNDGAMSPRFRLDRQGGQMPTFRAPRHSHSSSIASIGRPIIYYRWWA